MIGPDFAAAMAYNAAEKVVACAAICAIFAGIVGYAVGYTQAEKHTYMEICAPDHALKFGGKYRCVQEVPDEGH
jgi:hypothetical protein